MATFLIKTCVLATLLLSGTHAAARLPRVSEGAQQVVSLDRNALQPAKVTVTADANIPLPAEIATVQLSFYLSNITRDVVVEESAATLDRVQSIVKQLSGPGSLDGSEEAMVESFPSFSSRIFRMNGRTFNDEPSEFQSSPMISVRFRITDLLQQFFAEIDDINYLQNTWIDWELSSTTKAKTMAALRKKAFDNAIQAGQEWAELLGMQRMSTLELREETEWEGIREGRYGQYADFSTLASDFDGKVQLPNVTMNLALECTFALETIAETGHFRFE